MASNSFGTLFRVTTWGESHGPAIGCVIDGCPAGLVLDVSTIQKKLERRSPGKNSMVSARREPDVVEIVSGIFEGKTTGAPISLLIRNQDQDSSVYEAQSMLLKPGHAQYPYLEKYGIFDWRGGGRASARETACRVAAGAIADLILKEHGICVTAHLASMGSLNCTVENPTQEAIDASLIFCPDAAVEKKMKELIEELQREGDSIGGSVTLAITGCPAGLGDPVYEKLESRLAYAMMSIPAARAFEIGDGCQSATMKGSEHNDLFKMSGDKIVTETNHAGGVLGGITTGMPIRAKVFFKPTSSIRKEQKTLTLDGKQAVMAQPKTARHDPCVAIRAVAVCEAMAQLVLVDALLMQRVNKMEI